jgi:hypothetical protein
MVFISDGIAGVVGGDPDDDLIEVHDHLGVMSLLGGDFGNGIHKDHDIPIPFEVKGFFQVMIDFSPAVIFHYQVL